VQTKVERLRGHGPYLTHTVSATGTLANAGSATKNPSRKTIVLIIEITCAARSEEERKMCAHILRADKSA
jgi:hypothetical protein